MGLMVVCFSAGDEEWDDANEQNVLEASEQDNETAPIKPDDEDEEEEEELQRAFSRHSEVLVGRAAEFGLRQYNNALGRIVSLFEGAQELQSRYRFYEYGILCPIGWGILRNMNGLT
ncbi:zinc finger protein 423 isoform X1 [Vespula maculifrons]|uniref:Zinc finger protein 423 isoform X1 n=1 Tax=Vespula maculifrons TaxID=7453 RepID=A0ABD2AT15_VESMC